MYVDRFKMEGTELPATDASNCSVCYTNNTLHKIQPVRRTCLDKSDDSWAQDGFDFMIWTVSILHSKRGVQRFLDRSSVKGSQGCHHSFPYILTSCCIPRVPRPSGSVRHLGWCNDGTRVINQLWLYWWKITVRSVAPRPCRRWRSSNQKWSPELCVNS
jgi:hypothetical protein